LYPAAKRGLDLAGAALGLVSVSPLLLVAAVAIKLNSPGPVLFRQRRLGRGGRPFDCLKLRTMVAGAPQMGSWQTADHDPRITRPGVLLRRFSLDELPQLLNVLTGSMSLVGPRPMVPQQAPEWPQEELRQRHSVRPGLSGLAQISGRSSLVAAESNRLDLEYCRRRSMALDLSILWRTVAVVLSGSGTN
jgi:lipopolysaccharide/colanic/teichoic acid biosynthesis glycosyltransferase